MWEARVEQHVHDGRIRHGPEREEARCTEGTEREGAGGIRGMGDIGLIGGRGMGDIGLIGGTRRTRGTRGTRGTGAVDSTGVRCCAFWAGQKVARVEPSKEGTEDERGRTHEQTRHHRVQVPEVGLCLRISAKKQLSEALRDEAP